MSDQPPRRAVSDLLGPFSLFASSRCANDEESAIGLPTHCTPPTAA
jgi:hypothetical protein